jgi:hypothetical protein
MTQHISREENLMATFGVWYRDPLKALPQQSEPFFQGELEKLWQAVCKHPSSRFKTAKVSKLKGLDINIASCDLPVYCLPIISNSLAKRIVGTVPPKGTSGFTLTNTGFGNISEIYMDQLGTGKKAAFLAFHELMHNKLGKGNEMHQMDIGGGGLAVESLELNGSNPFAVSLSPENIQILAPVLHKSAWQFQWPTQPGEG